MVNAILGTKLGQTQQFTSDGKRIPVTTIQAGPCWITQIHNGSCHSIQLGFGTSKRIAKAQVGHMKKAGLNKKPRFLREIRVDSHDQDLKVGSEITISDVFTQGDEVRVTGISSGKGFAGVVKRYNFKGGPRTHGQSDRERAPGSIGQTTTPGRVYKGKRMAGRMGGERVTIRGLEVVSINSQTNILTVKGLVPGVRNGLLIIQKEA